MALTRLPCNVDAQECTLFPQKKQLRTPPEKDQDNVPLGWNIWQVKRTRGGFSGYCSLNVRRSAYTPPVTEHSNPTTNKWSMKYMHMRRVTRGHDHDTSHQKQRAGAILSEHRRGYSVLAPPWNKTRSREAGCGNEQSCRKDGKQAGGTGQRWHPPYPTYLPTMTRAAQKWWRPTQTGSPHSMGSRCTPAAHPTASRTTQQGKERGHGSHKGGQQVQEGSTIGNSRASVKDVQCVSKGRPVQRGQACAAFCTAHSQQRRSSRIPVGQHSRAVGVNA